MHRSVTRAGSLCPGPDSGNPHFNPKRGKSDGQFVSLRVSVSRFGWESRGLVPGISPPGCDHGSEKMCGENLTRLAENHIVFSLWLVAVAQW